MGDGRLPRSVVPGPTIRPGGQPIRPATSRDGCMRILTVANQLGAWGGMERSQLAMCRALAERGHRIDLVYVDAGRLRRGVAGGRRTP